MLETGNVLAVIGASALVTALLTSLIAAPPSERDTPVKARRVRTPDRRRTTARSRPPWFAAQTIRAAGSVILVAAMLGAVITPSIFSAAPPAAAAAQADPKGCGYGTGGPDAATICWFDFAGYDQATAASTAGQNRTVSLPGGYTMTFNLFVTLSASSSTDVRAVPAYAPSLIGNSAYVGIPGTPVLRAAGSQAGAATTFALRNIVVKDSAGATVSGYSMVSADAEATAAGEQIDWKSNVPITTRALLRPAAGANPENGCQMSITGSGTNSLTCTGSGTGASRYGSALVQASSPTSFSATLRELNGAGAEAVIVGVMSSNVTVKKTVESRVNATDSFDLATVSPEGTVQGSASTGTGTSASTGAVSVLPRTANQPYTLREVATAGTQTDLGNYTQSWACTNTATGASTTLPTGGGTSKTIAPQPGDNITCTITNARKPAALALRKQAGTPVDVNGNGLVDRGDTIQYTFDVTNTGGVLISGITVDDAKAGSVTCPTAALAAGATLTCSAAAPYVITSADVQHGSVDNSATASGSPQGTTTRVTSAPSATSTPTTDPAPAITLVKSADPSGPGSYNAGQTITYSFTVTNTGNVPLNDITVDEGGFTGTGTISDPSCPSASLAVGAQEVCTATYTLTQADIDAGSVTNNATAEGTPPGVDTPTPSGSSTVTIPYTAEPALAVKKTANVTSVTKAGDVVTYSFRVTNIGNVTLRNVGIEDRDFSGTGTLSTVTCPAAVLAVGENTSCSATYSFTQADIDAGRVTNTATASGTPPGAETSITSDPSTVSVSVTSAALTLVKTVVDGAASASSWTLTAAGPADALPGPSGASGSPETTRVRVSPDRAYSLSESGGPATYVQVGEWTCVDDDTEAPVAADESTITIGPEQHVTCTARNSTAHVTLLKEVADGPAASSDWTLTATPDTFAQLSAVSVPGEQYSADGNPDSTFEVRPEHAYTLTEALADPDTTSTYRQVALEIRNQDGSWSSADTDEIVAPRAGESATYRFVNRMVVPITLPLTGGTGSDRYYLIGGTLLLGALALGAFGRIRRSRIILFLLRRVRAWPAHRRHARPAQPPTTSQQGNHS